MAFCYSYPHPAVAVDIVVFTIRNRRLAVLLIERGSPPFRGEWALPGGFVGLEERLERAASRELREETGVAVSQLEQLHTFGDPARDPRERVISVAHLAIVADGGPRIVAASDAKRVDWFAADALPPLAFDHSRILVFARKRLAAKCSDALVALEFMPERFTLADLQAAQEAVGGKPVDRRNFRKRVIASGAIEPTGAKVARGPGKPAQLFRRADGPNATTSPLDPPRRSGSG